MKTAEGRKGFTLIELTIVVAILAFIAAVAVGRFKDVREAAAKKTNFASLVAVQRTIETAIAHEDSLLGMFNYCDSLVTMSGPSSIPTGSAEKDAANGVGTYHWASDNRNWAYEGAAGGIYAGQTVPMPVYDANGNGNGTTPSYDSVQEANTGIPSALRSMLGIYYLSDSERTALHDAGVGILQYHNPSSAQAYGTAARHPWHETSDGYSADGLKMRGGGPGFRPDQSAFYPVRVASSNNTGLAVAVLDPSQSASIYRAFVSSKQYPDDKETLDTLSTGEPEGWFTWGLPRLVVIGLGKYSDTVNKYFDAFPRDGTRDKTEYWNYCLVFQLNNGGRAGSDAKFVGVVDSRGNPAVSAEGNMDWN